MLPGGRTLLAGMEGSLAGDTTGIVRFQTWERHRGDFALAAQYGYRTDAGLDVSETTATPDGRLLVLERGFTAGVGNTVRLYLADLRATLDRHQPGRSSRHLDRPERRTPGPQDPASPTS